MEGKLISKREKEALTSSHEKAKAEERAAAEIADEAR